MGVDEYSPETVLIIFALVSLSRIERAIRKIPIIIQSAIIMKIKIGSNLALSKLYWLINTPQAIIIPNPTPSVIPKTSSSKFLSTRL